MRFWNIVQLGIIGLALLALAVCSYTYVQAQANLAHSEQVLEQKYQTVQFGENTSNVYRVNLEINSMDRGLYFPIGTNSSGSIYLKEGQKSVICTSFTQ